MKKIKYLILVFISFISINVYAEDVNCDVLLQKGNRSNDVKVLQARLNEVTSCSLDVDGAFGRLTKNCVESYQKSQKLGVDGIVGPQTCTELNLKSITRKTVNVVGEVNVRKYATTSSMIIGTASTGDSFNVSYVSGNFYQINYNGQIGYISSNFTDSKINNTSSSSNSNVNTGVVNTNQVNVSDVKTTLLSDEYFVIGDTVNVRKKATILSERITTVNFGKKVKVIGVEGNWYKVVVNGKNGYIRSDLLTDSQIIVDLSDQKVYVFIHKDFSREAIVVTGMKNKHDTPLGNYLISSNVLETNRYLDGYNDNGSKYHAFVNYWMPFNGGVGFHDATWRSSFGGNIYDGSGSHGCVNMQLGDAEFLFNSIKNNDFIVTVRD